MSVEPPEAPTTADIARVHFFFPNDMTPAFDHFDAAIHAADTRLAGVGAGFRKNLMAIIDTLSVPYILTFYGALRLELERLRFHKTITAFRPIPPGVTPYGPEHRKLVDAVVDAATRESWMQHFDENNDRIQEHVCNELARYPSVEQTSAPAELIRQSVVLLWGALEVLITRCHRYRTGLVSKGPRNCLQKLYPEFNDGHDALKHFSLWMLFQQRHLIAHRSGFVDEKYLAQTGDNVAKGTKIFITPANVQQYLSAAVAFATDLVTRCTEAGPSQVSGPNPD